MTLAGEKQQRLYNSLLRAFPSIQALERMAAFKLDVIIEEIADGDLRNRVFKLIQWAIAYGQLEELILGARQSNPGNIDLFLFAQEMGLAVSTPPKREMQRLLKGSTPYLEVNYLLKNLAVIENQVCRIEILLDTYKYAYGTGFLIGPDVVITNHHVMKYVIEMEQRKVGGLPFAKPENVTLRFDYKKGSETGYESSGKKYHIEKVKWLIDSSPMSSFDSLAEKNGGVPNIDEMDYALLRVAGRPGNEIIGVGPKEDIQRGWIKFPEKNPEYRAESLVTIIQHPHAETLKAAFQTMIGMNANETRFTYSTCTESGSSGSPCFNANWELIGMHQTGDPDYSDNYVPTYNQGVTIHALLSLWNQRNLMDQIGN